MLFTFVMYVQSKLLEQRYDIFIMYFVCIKIKYHRKKPITFFFLKANGMFLCKFTKCTRILRFDFQKYIFYILIIFHIINYLTLSIL